jgi:penicillin-binding protein 1A
VLKKLLLLIFVFAISGVVGLFFVIKHVESSLPQLITVNDFEPRLVSQVFDRNGKKIGEFSRERRILTPYNQIPKDLVSAFLAAEDDQFFKHQGINFLAIVRAFIANMKAGKTVQGGSTITQQVAKTLLLKDSEKTLNRKIKEALLAHRMESHLSKEDILYLYLNQIFFGQSSYGIAVASETYFRKTVQELTLPEMAILAGLPQAPSRYSPIINPQRAKERQIYVLKRMAEVGYITQERAQEAMQTPVKIYFREKFQTYAPYFLETIRLLLIDKIGEEAVLDKGLKIYSSLDLTKQLSAQESILQGLKALDKRQGFRGTKQNMKDPKEIGEFLLKTRNKHLAEITPERIMSPSGKFEDWGPLELNKPYTGKLPQYLKVGLNSEAIVTKVDDTLGLVTVRLGEIEGLIDLETLAWTKKGPSLKVPSEILKQGDIILVNVKNEKFISPRLEKLKISAQKLKKNLEGLPKPEEYAEFELDQEPLVEGSLLSLDQENQDVLAMVGGYNYAKSEFNRALQAARQTGSAFKAIVYASALDKGYTPSTPIMDSPIVYNEVDTVEKEGQESVEEVKTWKPTNHSKTFGGDIIFRNALVKSLNVPTVKIVEDVGVSWASDYARRLGLFSPLNMDFTLALGSSGITLYEMTKAFSTFGRLGKKMEPVIIHNVKDRTGKEILGPLSLDLRFQKEMEDLNKKFEDRKKTYLDSVSKNTFIDDNKKPDKNFFFDDPTQLIKPTTAYVMTTLLKAVVEDRNGTGGRARALGRDVAGKTGTTNGYFDAWFIGYTPQIATGVWVGFDSEKTLGAGEVGGKSALPIWVEYMKVAHQNLPIQSFQVPPGIVFANIDGETGNLASPKSKLVLRQAFVEGTEPKSTSTQNEQNTDFYKQDLSE